MRTLDPLLQRLTAQALPTPPATAVSGRPSLVIACLAAAWCALVNLACGLIGTSFAPGLLLASAPAFLGLLGALQLNARGQSCAATWGLAAAGALSLLTLPAFGFGPANHFHFGFLVIALAVALLMPSAAWRHTVLIGLSAAAGFVLFERLPTSGDHAPAWLPEQGPIDPTVQSWLAVVVPLNLAGSFAWAAWLAGHVAATAQDRLGELALVHPATGLPNERAFESAFGQFIARVRRLHQPAALMLIAIDGLDEVRSQQGPAATESLKLHVARLVRGRLRHHDVVAHLDQGGFAVLLEARPDIAVDVAEAMRRQIQDTPLALDGQRRLATTVCIGLIAVHAGMTDKTARQQAEDALTRARKGGRNRVEIHLGASVLSPGVRRVFSGGAPDAAVSPPP